MSTKAKRLAEVLAFLQLTCIGLLMLRKCSGDLAGDEPVEDLPRVTRGCAKYVSFPAECNHPGAMALKGR